MELTKTNKAIRNMGWGAISKITAILLPFIVRTVMIRVLGEEYVGVNSLFSSILQVLSLSELGFGTAIVFSMYKPIAEKNNNQVCALLNLYRKIYLYVGAVILAVGMMLIPFLPYLIGGKYPSDINISFIFIVFLLNTSVSYFLFGYKSAILDANQRNDLVNKGQTAVNIVGYILQIIIICTAKNYYVYLSLVLLTTIAQNIAKLYLTNKYYPDFICKGKVDRKTVNEIKQNVIALMFHKLGGTVLNSADNIVISAFLGLAIVARYNNYYYIMNSVDSIIIICFSALTAIIGNSFITDGIQKNRDNFDRILFFNGWMTGWCSIALMCLFQPFIAIWIGTKYQFENNIVLLIVIYFFIHSIRRTIIMFRDAAGMWKDNQWQPIVSAIFNVVTNMVLVQQIGLAGVLISSILSMVIIDIPWEAITFFKSKLECNSTKYFKNVIFYFLCSAVSVGITYLFCSLLPNYGVLAFCAKIVICIIVGNVCLWSFYHRTKEFVYYKQILKQWKK